MAGARTRHGHAAIRLGTGALAGGALAVGLSADGVDWGVAVTAGWCVLATVFLLWVWVIVGTKDSDSTADHAKGDDVSRATADLLLLGASVASLLAVGYTLIDARGRHGGMKALLIGLALLAVALAWGVVHTTFMLRYAAAYYSGSPGGIGFKDGAPDYRDLAYVAFTIGMTFQVSDTELGTKPIRRMVLRHALLSYLFGAVIVAVAINVIASLLKS